MKNVKDIFIKKGMSRNEVNEELLDYLVFIDDFYLGGLHKHRWRCECGDIFERKWEYIKTSNRRKCIKCLKSFSAKIFGEHKRGAEKCGRYEYIKSYREGDILSDGRLAKYSYIRVRHKYCGGSFDVASASFNSSKVRKCPHCCQDFDSSLKKHLEDIDIKYSSDIVFYKGELVNIKYCVKNYDKMKLMRKIKEYYYKRDITDSNIIVKTKNRKTLKVSKKDNFIGYHTSIKGDDFIEKYIDIEKNDQSGINIFSLSKSSSSKIWVKCLNNDKHDSYLVNCGSFTKGHGCPYCSGIKVRKEDSVGKELEKKYGENFEDEILDKDRNIIDGIDVWSMSIKSNNKIWVKCQNKDYHSSYTCGAKTFLRSQYCPYCSSQKTHPKDSFAQYHIDNTDPDFLEKYWDYEKNTVNPWEISPKSNRNKVWIKCQEKDYHSSYETKCNDFTGGNRCPYCSKRTGKLHKLDSFGYHHFDKVMSWHPDNDISPFRVTVNNGSKYKFICEKCNAVFEKVISKITGRDEWCPNCSSSKGEKRVSKWLIENNINYIYDEAHFEDLLSDLGNPLRPDFILPEHKVWIEYDGEFHFKKVTGSYGKDFDYKKQQYHDKLKDEYAKKHGYKMIRIPYWEFDNIEKILNNKIRGEK
ncbi:zinc-ribbon domain-containing protein [Clostridium sp.]|uniref:zinc-ribbon domain-containing protein n=1 Tax=Clostridium sp. TaxID=1506 RepID=UPI003F3EAD2B